MTTRYEKITHVGREDSSISLHKHMREMRKSTSISKKDKKKWYKRGLKILGKQTGYVEHYYKDTDAWTSDLSNDALLSWIASSGGHSGMLKIAGRRIAELADEVEKNK